MRDKCFGSHELQPHEESTKVFSKRNVGLIFAAFFVLLAALTLWYETAHWPIWLGIACVALIWALATPQLVVSANGVWTKNILLFRQAVSTSFIALLFYGCVVPVGFLMRLSGKDPLRLRYEPASESYWIKRTPPGPDAASFKSQF